MSLKLLKQSVDIVQEELQGSKQNKTSGKRSGSYNIKAEDKKFKPYKKNIQEVKSDLKTKDKKSEENIKRLLALSMNTINIKDAEKIVQRAHKGRYVKKIIPKVKQESIFTEEDFRKFEEEYFNS
ncbi:active regulator of SIRT1 [Musca domestica]|uniref:Active regulator of SIRT1 n=1 Tax=Musca domestica TaxID=7370 RepID=A0A1I8MCX2_MUSDO|nr:active regulator of SIRT1 [Musca domestica]